MRGNDIRCVPVSETSVMLYLADVIDVGLARAVGEIARAIAAEFPEVKQMLIEGWEQYANEVGVIPPEVPIRY